MLDPSSTDEISCYEIATKNGLKVRDILQELATTFSADVLSFIRSETGLPFTFVINHYKMVDLGEEVQEGDRIDIHLGVVVGG